MSKKNINLKVGLFVSIGLIMLAGLIIQFAKGYTFFTRTYELNLKTINVGGIKPKASVLMAGVPVGYVESTELEPDNKSVIIKVKIISKYQIHSDALFFIEQAGFLGDQYISIVPQDNLGPVLQNGDTVICKEPFNLQDAARTASHLMIKLSKTADAFNDAANNISRILLTESALRDITNIVHNVKILTEQSTNILMSLNDLIGTNAAVIPTIVSNVNMASVRFNEILLNFQGILSTNSQDVSATIRNLAEATSTAEKLLHEIEVGNGLLSGIIKNPVLSKQFEELLLNLSNLSSNLNKYGIFYKPKAPTRVGQTTKPLIGK
jgi:phospholipid/cholesterol/gamma-HCH transport system substrate-binding protein